MNYRCRKTEYYPCDSMDSLCDVKPLKTNHCYINMYIYGDGNGHIQKRSSTFKLEIALHQTTVSTQSLPREFLMSAADGCTIFLPSDSNGPISPQYDTFLEKRNHIPTCTLVVRTQRVQKERS